MAWIVIIIVGALVGWIANLIVGRGGNGLLYDILLGIVGSILARLIFFDALGIGSAASAGTFSFYGILWGIIGAIVLIFILRVFRVYQ